MHILLIVIVCTEPMAQLERSSLFLRFSTNTTYLERIEVEKNIISKTVTLEFISTAVSSVDSCRMVTLIIPNHCMYILLMFL